MGIDARVDSEIAGHRVERLLGRGGMSSVYLAEQLLLHRKVALKLMASGRSTSRSAPGSSG